jgi:hypothetical protein
VNFLKIKLLIIAVIMFAASSAFASLSYDVNVDTTSLAGTAGYLYLQYNTGINNTATSIATVQNFATDGTLGATVPSAIPNGGTYVTGTLPGTVSFTSGYYATQDYNQAITFGNSLNFNLLLPTGTASSAGSNFTLWLAADAAGATPLKTADGLLLTIGLNADGTATPVIADAGTTATPTPIPAAAWLLGSGLMGLAGVRRRKQI